MADTLTAAEIEKFATWAAKQLFRAELAEIDRHIGPVSDDVATMTDDELLAELTA